MKKLLSLYGKALESRPLATKMATSGVLAGIGDFFCQYVEKSKEF